VGHSPTSTGTPISPADLKHAVTPISPESLLPTFEAELEKVGGKAYRASSVDELYNLLRAIVGPCHTACLILSRNPLLARLNLRRELHSWAKKLTIWPEDTGCTMAGATDGSDDFKQASFSASVGITGVDFALAETGSLVLSSLTEGSQLVSLAPPVHVALYQRHQLVGSLDEILEKLPISLTPGSPSPARSVVFITGTSRTADIEQILIRGVHGPRELHVILVEDSCLQPS